ncbi:MAG: acetyl-CoA C-acetyltransferase, partial [Chloroflexi bacterium]|nr:acetyl-CoA C-acetyltransferase [Chloroflexota bacterium]
MRNAVIVSGARTPVGRFGGAFKNYRASELGAVAIRAAVERAGIDPRTIDDVYFGNVLQAAEAGYAPRLASLGAGIP